MAKKKRGEPGYWIERKKMGRPKNIKSPKQLWELACEYFESIDSRPFRIQEQRRGSNRISKDTNLDPETLADLMNPVVYIEKPRPYTWGGLSNYLFEKDITSNLNHYQYNLDGRYSDFVDVIDAIDKVIYEQKFEGAAVGVFNQNIIARDLGLVDKSHVEVKEEQPLFGPEEDDE